MTRLSLQAIIAGRPVVPQRARVAGVSAPLSKITGHPRSLVGSDPTATLTATDIANLDAQVNAQNATFAAAAPTPALLPWSTKWIPFLGDWKVWFADHGAGTGLGGTLIDFFTDASLKAEFDGFVGRFNELLREWTAPASQGGLAMPSPAKPAAIPELTVPWYEGIVKTLGTVGTIALVAVVGIGAVELYRSLEHKRKA